MPVSRFIGAALTMVLLAGTPATSASQIGALRKKAEEAKKKVEESAKKPAADTAKVKGTDSTKASTAASPPTTSAPTAAAPKQGTSVEAKVWDNYDFVPGNKVIFYTDFSEDRVGNFARGLKYVGGQLDVVERDGVKMLRSTARSTLLIPVGKKLPERFTLEIDVIAPTEPCCGYEVIAFEGGAELDRGDASAEAHWHSNVVGMIGGGLPNSEVAHPEAFQETLRGRVAHVRVLMDSGYFKMYTNERRMYNIPQFNFKRDSVIRVFVNGNADDNVAVFLTGIRVAESETDVMYDALSAKGRWATQGILFASGKAELQPESRPVLKEIASTLKQHGDLRILIEGHTDNVGAAASNLTLSDARAAAVKAALVADFGIDGARITTKGFGDTKPAVPNASATGRAQNRRVEIVKQ